MIKDYKIDPSSHVAQKHITINGVTAISQTGILLGSYKPGYAFKILGVQVQCAAITAALTVDVQIGSTSVLTGAITPVATTLTAGTLSTTLASILGGSTDVINAKYTTDGSGAATGLCLIITYRPMGLSGEGVLAEP